MVQLVPNNNNNKKNPVLIKPGNTIISNAIAVMYVCVYCSFESFKVLKKKSAYPLDKVVYVTLLLSCGVGP